MCVCAPLSLTLILLLLPKFYPAHDNLYSNKKANLEMNKEGLAADLVCLLDERSEPRNSAKFQEQIERLFIAGAARIDLIAKVMDLDNEIGGHNFDIPNLEETANGIESLGNSGDKDLCDWKKQRQDFPDNCTSCTKVSSFVLYGLFRKN